MACDGEKTFDRYSATSTAGDAKPDAAPMHDVDGDIAFRSGPVGSAVSLSGQNFIDCGDVADFGYFDKFTIACWVLRESDADGVIWSRMKDEPDGAGFNLQLVDGRVQLNLVQRWLDDSLRVETTAPIPKDRWTHVAVTYDATRLASGVRIYIDGQRQELHTLTDLLYQSFAAKEPFRLGAGGPSGRLRGSIDELRVYRACLPAEEIELIATATTPANILATPVQDRSPGELKKLQAYYVAEHAAMELRADFKRLATLRREQEKLGA